MLAERVYVESIMRRTIAELKKNVKETQHKVKVT
jgi:hypothetical protein